MLRTLSVWNFALLEEVSLAFDEGLTILTGETGAGKSILIDAVGIILGHRASVDFIRNGAQWFRVEAVFDIAKRQDIAMFLQEHAIEEADGLLIISRRVAKTGRNLIAVNGCHTTLTILKMLGSLLVDMHGQHENQALLRPDSQMAMLDAAHAKITETLEVYRLAYRKWRALEKRLLQKETDSRQNAQRIDMLQWQIEEISAANLKESEEEDLEAEIRILTNAEKITNLAKDSYRLLNVSDKAHNAILPALAEVKKNIELLSRHDLRAENTVRILDEALCQLEECSYEIRDFGEAVEYSPERLEKLQERMDVIYKLRKKYGATVSDVLEHYRKAKQELAEMENYDQILMDLKKECSKAEQEVDEIAARLTKFRQEAAKQLAKEICQHLLHLGMPNAKLNIQIEPLIKKSVHGADRVQVLFSANLGESAKPLEKVASGGELSRIALAIKTVSAAKDPVGVMIFDEIDTGIGGKTAQMVAERIAMVAVHKQVLCITHLAQIASMADAHIYIEKQTQNNTTKTLLRRLSVEEQVEELARMASGADQSRAALENAAAMLQMAQEKKSVWKSSCICEMDHNL